MKADIGAVVMKAHFVRIADLNGDRSESPVSAPALARLLSGETSRAVFLRDLKPKSQSAFSQRASVVVPMPVPMTMVVIVPVVVIQAAVEGELL